MKSFIGAAAALAALAGGAAQAQELRIGFLNTTSGPGAVLGRHFENGWKLGLEHQGWTKDGDRLGGVPAKVFYADDQVKPDVAVKEIDKFIKSDKVQVVAGILWSNIMIAASKPVLDAKVLLIGANSGPSPLAGEQCSPLFVSTSWSNDDYHEAAGELMQKDGIKAAVLMAPNYQGGKDAVTGFRRAYQGKIVDQIMFKLGESDFQADLSKVRASKPDGVFLFAPGAMGISFLKQWAAAGLDKEIKLYTSFVVDYATLPAIGDSALGSIHPSIWNPQSDHPRNLRFVKEYAAKFGHAPSHFAVQSYDAATAIAAGVAAAGGKVDDTAALARAIRSAPLASIRGDLKYQVNGFLIQPYYTRIVERGPDGKPFIKTVNKLSDRSDSYFEKCPPDRRI